MNHTVLFVLLSLSLPTLAAEPPHCRKGTFAALAGLRSGVISDTASKQVAFQGDDLPGCPDANNPKCEGKAQVGPKDTIMVSAAVRNGFRCAWFQPAKKGATGTWGWLPDSAITLHPDAASSTEPWVARFEQGGEWIAFKNVGGRLEVEGNAAWISKAAAGGAKGSPSGKLALNGRVLSYTDDSCMVLMVKMGDAVLASATGKCSPTSQGFSAIYDRAP